VNETWRRFAANWRPLLAAGLFAALLQVGLNVFVSKLPAPGGGLGAEATLGWWADWAQGVLFNARGGLPGLLAQFLLAPLAAGALFFAAARVLQEEAVAAAEIWRAALRHWGRLAIVQAVSTLLTLALLGALFASMSALFAAAGPLVMLATVILCIAALGLVMIPLGYYAPYMVVAEDRSALTALAKAFRILTARWWDTLNALGVWIALGLVESLIQKVAGSVPGVGAVLAWAVTAITVPFVVLYFSLRYEWNVKPMMTPPGGAGTFDPNPPIGQ
jgi:hypothetical protein